MAGGKIFAVTRGSRKSLYMRRKNVKKLVAKSQKPQIYKTPAGLRSEIAITLNYNTVIRLQSTVGVFGIHRFGMNIFDPDYTGGGHQPALHDQLATLYRRYQVLSCNGTFTFNNDGSQNTSHIVMAWPDKDSVISASTLLEQVAEQQLPSHSKVLTPNSNAKETIRVKYDTKKLFQLTDIYDDHQHIGEVGAAQSVYGFIMVGVQDVTASATSTNYINVYCKLRYRVRMFDPKEVAIS